MENPMPSQPSVRARTRSEAVSGENLGHLVEVHAARTDLRGGSAATIPRVGHTESIPLVTLTAQLTTGRRSVLTQDGTPRPRRTALGPLGRCRNLLDARPQRK